MYECDNRTGHRDVTDAGAPTEIQFKMGRLVSRAVCSGGWQVQEQS